MSKQSQGQVDEELDRKVREYLASEKNKQLMVQRLRDEVNFDDDAIIRYTKIRLQIDTDPQRPFPG